jgi:hypothetical protein
MHRGYLCQATAPWRKIKVNEAQRIRACHHLSDDGKARTPLDVRTRIQEDEKFVSHGKHLRFGNQPGCLPAVAEEGGGVGAVRQSQVSTSSGRD